MYEILLPFFLEQTSYIKKNFYDAELINKVTKYV